MRLQPPQKLAGDGSSTCSRERLGLSPLRRRWSGIVFWEEGDEGKWKEMD
jgi:hypothetical protein